MMNSKQIFRRMNEAYEEMYGDKIEDEWYGTDDEKEWKFHRPSIQTTIRMTMDEEHKRVYVEERKDGEQEYEKVNGFYSW